MLTDIVPRYGLHNSKDWGEFKEAVNHSQRVQGKKQNIEAEGMNYVILRLNPQLKKDIRSQWKPIVFYA